jgi:hypothetical protein
MFVKTESGGFHQIPIPPTLLEHGVYGPQNALVPWGAIATLALRATDLARHVSIEFAQSYDDLDYLQVALLDVPPVGRVALVDHLHAPEPGIEIHANVDDPIAADRAIAAVLQALKLPPTVVKWRRSRPNSLPH